jgi:hypothetical protein
LDFVNSSDWRLDLLDNKEHPSKIIDDMVFARLTAQEYFEKDFKQFSIFAKQRDGPHIWEHCRWELNYDVARGTEIPNSLLLGPWREESIRYLFWVTKSGARVDFIKSTSGEVSYMFWCFPTSLCTDIEIGSAYGS